MVAVTTFRMRDDDPRYPALRMADYMLGGGFLNSRLATRIRQEEGLSYGVGSQLAVPPVDDGGLFLTYAIFAPENGDRVVDAFRDELRKALEEGFTQEELDAAKGGYLDAQQNGRSNDGALAGQLSNNLFTDRTMEFIAAQEADVGALTLEEVNSALRDYVSLDGFSIFRAGDFANKLIP
jgi:zinc protease